MSLYGEATDLSASEKQEKKKHIQGERSDEVRKAHRLEYGFEGREYFTKTVPIFRPYPSETPPAVFAMWISIVAWIATGGWFAVSMIGYLLYWQLKAPIEAGERLNIERIFNEPTLNRWAVNVVLSLFVHFFMMLQMLFLIGYRMDRSIKKAFAGNLKRQVLTKDAQGDADAWDDGAELIYRHGGNQPRKHAKQSSHHAQEVSSPWQPPRPAFDAQSLTDRGSQRGATKPDLLTRKTSMAGNTVGSTRAGPTAPGGAAALKRR